MKKRQLLSMLLMFMAGFTACTIFLNLHAQGEYTDKPGITLKEYWTGE
jgi:hypothetical protein